VLPPDQLTLFLIAVFICISTLRIIIKRIRVNKIVIKLRKCESKNVLDLLDDSGCKVYAL